MLLHVFDKSLLAHHVHIQQYNLTINLYLEEAFSWRLSPSLQEYLTPSYEYLGYLLFDVDLLL